MPSLLVCSATLPNLADAGTSGEISYVSVLQISTHLQCSQVDACQTIRKALSKQLLLALKMSGKELVVNRGGVEALALTLVTAKPNGAVLYFTAYVGFPSFLPAHKFKLFSAPSPLQLHSSRTCLSFVNHQSGADIVLCRHGIRSQLQPEVLQ